MIYDDLVGAPYMLNGTDSNGIDCYNLIRELYRRRGIELPVFVSTHDKCLAHSVISGAKQAWEKIINPEPYAVVTIMITPPLVSHVGMVIEDCKHFIHARCKVGVAIEKLSKWQKRIEGYYIWKP